jgi:hypothetical protein
MFEDVSLSPTPPSVYRFKRPEQGGEQAQCERVAKGSKKTDGMLTNRSSDYFLCCAALGVCAPAHILQ